MDAVAFFFVANFCAGLLRGAASKSKVMLVGWKCFDLGVGDGVDHGAEGGGARGGCGLSAMRECGGVAPGEQAGGDGFGVAFDAGELAGDHDPGVGAEAEGWSRTAGAQM